MMLSKQVQAYEEAYNEFALDFISQCLTLTATEVEEPGLTAADPVPESLLEAISALQEQRRRWHQVHPAPEGMAPPLFPGQFPDRANARPSPALGNLRVAENAWIERFRSVVASRSLEALIGTG